jgi:hypothetical protein
LIPVLVALLADLSRLLTLLGRYWFLAMLLRAIALLPLGLLQFLFFLPVHWLLLRASRPGQSSIRLCSGTTERLRKARLEWLRGRKRHVLVERRELLALLGHRLKLMTRMLR